MRVSKKLKKMLGFVSMLFICFRDFFLLLLFHFLTAFLVLLTEAEALEWPLSYLDCISIRIQMENYMKIG